MKRTLIGCPGKEAFSSYTIHIFNAIIIYITIIIVVQIKLILKNPQINKKNKGKRESLGRSIDYSELSPESADKVIRTTN